MICKVCKKLAREQVGELCFGCYTKSQIEVKTYAEEDMEWITINGKHIPISAGLKGGARDKAIKGALEKKDSKGTTGKSSLKWNGKTDIQGKHIDDILHEAGYGKHSVDQVLKDNYKDIKKGMMGSKSGEDLKAEYQTKYGLSPAHADELLSRGAEVSEAEELGKSHSKG